MDSEKQPLLGEQNASESEPTLSELQANIREAQRRYWRAWSRTTSGKWHKWIMISVSMLLTLMLLFCMAVVVEDTLSDDDDIWHGPVKVPLEAHIMSKCPDAKDCLHDMILPAMMNVSDKVDFTLSFIGKSTREDGGVECMHGPEECLGNIIELCAAHMYPDPKIYLGFTMCMFRDYQDIPKRELVEDCALEHGIDVEKLASCTNEEDGTLSVERLQKSFNRTTEAGVTKSCTVRLNNEVRCIRDGGEWSDCEGGSTPEDLVKDIWDLWKDSSSYEYDW